MAAAKARECRAKVGRPAARPTGAGIRVASVPGARAGTGGLTPASLNVVLELGSSEAITGAVLEGLGVAVLSARAVQKDVRAGRLHAVRIEGLTLERDLYVVRDRRRACRPRHRLSDSRQFRPAPAASQS